MITKTRIQAERTTSEYIREKGIKPSPQRVAVMDYLLTHRTHPTAEEIFTALSPSMPTLSKTTVYNTLKLFVAQGAALGLDIDLKNARFDGDITPHVHFMCRRCGGIHDLPLAFAEAVAPGHLAGFAVDEVAVYLKGLCPACVVISSKTN